MKLETAYMQRVQRELSDIGVTTFRNNVGQYVARSECPHCHGELEQQRVMAHGERVIRYGVCNPGGHDLLGWKPVIIQPDQVGKKLAVFTSVETKVGRNRLTPPQVNFRDQVRLAGGIAVESRTIEDTIAEAVWP